MTVHFEFYILWDDKTWTVEGGSLRTDKESIDDALTHACHKKMESLFSRADGFAAVGPLYHIGEC